MPKQFNALGTTEEVTVPADLNFYASLASPAFTGTPTAPTPTQQSGDTQVANKKYVDDIVGNIESILHTINNGAS